MAAYSKLIWMCSPAFSVGNAILITAQMPEATRLADFKGWKETDAYVKKGEVGITI